MNPTETEKLLTATNFFYPSFLQGREPSDVAKVWSIKLKDLQFNDCINYLDKHVETSNFPPTIADFLQNASLDDKHLTPSKAFEIANIYAKKYGFYRSAEAMEDLKVNYPIIYRTIKNLGGFTTIINNENGLKTRFINNYELTKDNKELSNDTTVTARVEVKMEVKTEQEIANRKKRLEELKCTLINNQN